MISPAVHILYGIKFLQVNAEIINALPISNRNEVWRYQKENYKGVFRNMSHTFFKGFKWAVLGMVITIAVDKYFGISESKKRAHGHH